MLEARVVLDKDFTLGEVDPRLFGGFVEHLGRCVYEGLYEPEHPRADADGFRTDVIELVRELGMPIMRYPGGNFVSGYNWEDGVGPKKARPRRLDLAWKCTETNQFGTNEFVDWCRKAGTEPMLAVNLGTRGPDEARNLVEYCNHPGGSAWSDLRKQHGHPNPHGVKVWCLGNEMDGPWQIGQKTATEYGRIAREAAKLMKWTDPSIELVVCGSSGRGMRTFAAWEAEVLGQTYEHVEYVSIHTYYGSKNDTPEFLARPDEMGEFIEEVVATCDHVAAKRRTRRQMMLSFDEWNVWGDWRIRDHPIESRAVAPRHHEGTYTMLDALVVGGMLITLLNHCDRVRIGCLAQTVNVIAPVRTEPGGPAWRQTIFHPFVQASALGRGTVLRQVVDCPRYDAKGREGVPTLTSACVLDPSTGGLTVFAVNRSLDEPLELCVELRGFGELRVADWTVLRHDDLAAANTAEAPDTVTPRMAPGAAVEDGCLSAALGPASWNALRLSPA